jgi:hypothetical protein
MLKITAILEILNVGLSEKLDCECWAQALNLIKKIKFVKVGARQAHKTVGPDHVCTQVF